MPEGDTIHKLAAFMAPDLVDQPITSLWLRQRGEVGDLVGRRVTAVRALGKNLLMTLGPSGERGVIFHSHLGMYGSWHRYRPDERWKQPRWKAAASLGTPRHLFVLFEPMTSELVLERALRIHPQLSRLGPDLLAERFELERILRRARDPGYAHLQLSELLLDQRVACGLGNVYKSELLFLFGLHPDTRVRDADDDTLAALYTRARELMQRNLGGWPRTTTFDARERRPRPGEPRLYVYGRLRGRCLQCGELIQMRRQGDQARSTWWCPRCQPAPDSV